MHHRQLRTAAGGRNTHKGLCTTHTSTTKSKRKTKASETICTLKARRCRGHFKAAFSCFWCLGALWPTNSCLQEPHKTRTNRYKWHEAGKQDGPGDKFPPGRPHTPASSTPVCPQAFPGWPIEWVTYPDSNTLWQRDLETDVSCHWRGADEEMVSRLHALYLSLRTEGGGRSGCLTGDVGGRKEERWRVRVRVAAAAEGCKRRNKSSQSNLWQWLLQCH